MRKSWDEYFYGIALKVAERSACLSIKIGAILVMDKVVVCEGYNGPSRGVPHCGKERLKSDDVMRHLIENNTDPVFGTDEDCPRRRLGFSSGTGLNLCPAAHAEANCIANAARLGIKTKGTTMYVTCGVPCKNCLALIRNAGILEVVVTEEDHYYDTLSKFLVQVMRPHLLIRNYEFSGFAEKKGH